MARYSEAMMYVLGYVNTDDWKQAMDYFKEEATRKEASQEYRAGYKKQVQNLWDIAKAVDKYWGTNHVAKLKDHLGICPEADAEAQQA